MFTYYTGHHTVTPARGADKQIPLSGFRLAEQQ
jgi:hypothetical protein